MLVCVQLSQRTSLAACAPLDPYFVLNQACTVRVLSQALFVHMHCFHVHFWRLPNAKGKLLAKKVSLQSQPCSKTDDVWVLLSYAPHVMPCHQGFREHNLFS